MISKSRIPILLVLLLLTGCLTSPPEGITPVSDFELEKYLGTWYEIARLDHPFERGLSQVTAEYSIISEDTIRVLNRGYDPDNARWSRAEGKAKFRGDETIGSLKVSFFGPFYGGYHIFALDENYETALISGPTKNYFWILSRSPEIDEAVYEELVRLAHTVGIPTEELIRVDQTQIEESP